VTVGRRIVVPLDGSVRAERALQPAMAIARQARGLVRLVAVDPPWVGTELLPWIGSELSAADHYRQARERMAGYLDGVARQVGETGPTVETEVRSGRPEEEILDACASWDCDLLVMATHGRGGFGRLWLGSVTDRVIRRASVPLLLVSAADASERGGPAPDHGSIRTILLPLDGSSLATQAVAPAHALGRLFDAEYVLVRVVVPVVLSRAPFDVAPPITAVHPERVAAARRELDETAGRLRAAGCQVRAVVSEEADPARALIEMADSMPGSLVAIASHGWGGLRRAVLGSVADKLVRGATRPTLVVRPSRSD
jgi:nucleotide-binding universal stress UspA family protein